MGISTVSLQLYTDKHICWLIWLSYVQPAAGCGPAGGFMMPSLGFLCSISNLHCNNLSYVENPEFDIFDTGGGAQLLSATFSRLHCVLGDFHMSPGTLAQNFLLVFFL